mgnify:FL=1
MKKSRSIILLSMTGLATAASAQNFSLSILLSSQTADTSGGSAVVTATVYGDADVGTHMLGGSFSLVSNSQMVQDMTWTPAFWSSFNTDGGYAGNGNYNETNYGQLWPLGGIFPPPPSSALGMAIGSFEITLAGTGEVEFDLVAGSPFSLQTVDEFTGVAYLDTDGTLSLGSASISILPAPGGLSFFALGGFCLSRRRRR